MTEIISQIPSRLKNVAVGGHVAGAGVCNLRNNVIFGASAWAVWVYS
jgi:hypothetical protein